MTDLEGFNVQVIYALPEVQKVINARVAAGTSAIEVVRLSGLTDFFPQLDLDTIKLGVFSRQIKHTDIITKGQRIEVYRPLIADPKDVRRRRAEKAKDEGRANKVTGGRS